MGNLVNIAYFGGTHGAFLKYFIDRFSELTPEIKELPFEDNGSSHSLKVKYSEKIYRYTFEDDNGNVINNYEPINTEPHILIMVQEQDLLNQIRLLLYRPGDHEIQPLNIHEKNNLIICSQSFINFYSAKIKEIYDIDLNKNNSITKLVIRDFLKIIFLNKEKHQILQGSKKTLKNINKNTICMNVSDFYNEKTFFNKIEEINKKLKLEIKIDNESIELHKEFLNRLYTFKTLERANNIIDCLKKEEFYDLTDIDTVEQAFVSAWIEQTYKFIIVPNTNNFFKDTLEVLEYIKYYPNHYKAMNPNLPTFNGISNPFYLWKLKK
jgi:hypothetical protein